MKLDIATGTVQSTAVFNQSTKMSFDENSTSLIMRSLTNMYAEPEKAILREYISNAFDSHVLAGQTKPISVSFPNRLNSNLIVQDFGVGMSRDELVNIYSKYGASTKRNSNDLIGAFGLGAKSALALVSQFTVVSVKDGKKNTVIVSKDETEVGVLNFFDEVDTEEPNGVTVTIPLGRSVANLDTLFLAGFPTGTILVDGNVPAKSLDDETQFKPYSNGWVERYNSGQNRDHYNGQYIKAFIGPVLYSIDPRPLYDNKTEEEIEALKPIIRFFCKLPVNHILNIPNGSVDLTPNREEIVLNKRSIATIVDLMSAFRDEVLADIATVAATFTDRKKFFIYLAEQASYGYVSSLPFQGVDVTAELPLLKDASNRVAITQTRFDYRSNNTIRASHSPRRYEAPYNREAYNGGANVFELNPYEGSHMQSRLLSEVLNGGRKYVLVTDAPTPERDPQTKDFTAHAGVSALHVKYVKLFHPELSRSELYGFHVFVLSVKADELDEFTKVFATKIFTYEEYSALVKKAVREEQAKKPKVTREKVDALLEVSAMGYSIPKGRSGILCPTVVPVTDIAADAKFVIFDTEVLTPETEYLRLFVAYVLYGTGRRVASSQADKKALEKKFGQGFALEQRSELLMRLLADSKFVLVSVSRGRKVDSIIAKLGSDRVVSLEDAITTVFNNLQNLQNGEDKLSAMREIMEGSDWVSLFENGSALEKINEESTRDFIQTVANGSQSLKSALESMAKLATRAYGSEVDICDSTLVNLVGLDKAEIIKNTGIALKNQPLRYPLLHGRYTYSTAGKLEEEVVEYINFKDSTRKNS